MIKTADVTATHDPELDLVLARRFHGLGERRWAAYSLLTGIGFLIVFGGIAPGRRRAP